MAVAPAETDDVWMFGEVVGERADQSRRHDRTVAVIVGVTLLFVTLPLVSLYVCVRLFHM